MKKIFLSRVFLLGIVALANGKTLSMPLHEVQTCGFTSSGTYTSSFKSAEDLKGWTKFRAIPQKVDDWSVGAGKAFHDYAAGYTLQEKRVDDWLISPAFTVDKGAQLDSVVFKNVGMMMSVKEGDTIGVYLLHGSPNPNLAPQKDLLVDVRGDNYKPYAMMSCKNIPLVAGDEPCYIAFRYQNQEFESYWYSIGFYHLALSGVKKTSGVELVTDNQLPIEIVATHANSVHISGLTGESHISLIDLSGRCVDTRSCNAPAFLLDLSAHPTGVYFVSVETQGNRMVKKIMKP